MYDKGTQFGLKQAAHGVTENILVSLPLTTRYEYNFKPKPNSAEAKMQEVVEKAKDWI